MKTIVKEAKKLWYLAHLHALQVIQDKLLTLGYEHVNLSATIGALELTTFVDNEVKARELKDFLRNSIPETCELKEMDCMNTPEAFIAIKVWFDSWNSFEGHD